MYMGAAENEVIKFLQSSADNAGYIETYLPYAMVLVWIKFGVKNFRICCSKCLWIIPTTGIPEVQLDLPVWDIHSIPA